MYRRFITVESFYSSCYFNLLPLIFYDCVLSFLYKVVAGSDMHFFIGISCNTGQVHVMTAHKFVVFTFLISSGHVCFIVSILYLKSLSYHFHWEYSTNCDCSHTIAVLKFHCWTYPSIPKWI